MSADGGGSPGSGNANEHQNRGDGEPEVAEEMGSHSDDSFETAGSQGYLTEDDGDNPQDFSVSMVTLGWMNGTTFSGFGKDS